MDGGSLHHTEGKDQDHATKKKCKNGKWFSEKTIQIAEKRKEVKDKGEKEKYFHVNAEIQRIARRDKKAFLRDQCKETE